MELSKKWLRTRAKWRYQARQSSAGIVEPVGDNLLHDDKIRALRQAQRDRKAEDRRLRARMKRSRKKLDDIEKLKDIELRNTPYKTLEDKRRDGELRHERLGRPPLPVTSVTLIKPTPLVLPARIKGIDHLSSYYRDLWASPEWAKRAWHTAWGKPYFSFAQIVGLFDVYLMWPHSEYNFPPGQNCGYPLLVDIAERRKVMREVGRLIKRTSVKLLMPGFRLTYKNQLDEPFVIWWLTEKKAQLPDKHWGYYLKEHARFLINDMHYDPWASLSPELEAKRRWLRGLRVDLYQDTVASRQVRLKLRAEWLRMSRL